MLEPWILRESRTHQHHVPPVGLTDGAQIKSTSKDTMGGLLWRNPKIWCKRGKFTKNIVNKFSQINLINNTTTSLPITVHGGWIADIGSKLHCCLRNNPTDNDFPVAALHAVQPDISQILSTVQANMKLSTLNKEARRGYKFPTLTQTLYHWQFLQTMDAL